MRLTQINAEQWKQVKEIYMEAFPKAERKPFFVLRHSVKSKKAQILTATEDGTLMGFVMVIPYGGMVMVDYLAVSSKIRSRGTGSQIMQQVCEYFADKRIVLLIERLDDNAENAQQRSARRRFYLKNGFTSLDIFIKGASGEMEVLNWGGKVSAQEYLSLQKHALGNLLFSLSGITLAK